MVLQGVILVAVFGAGILGPAWSGPARLALAVGGAALIATGGTLAVRGVVDLGDNLTVVPRPPDGARLVDHDTASPPAIGGGFVLGGILRPEGTPRGGLAW